MCVCLIVVLGIDFTYYDIVTNHQALEKSLAATEQVDNYKYTYFNAGEITNKGFEVVIDGTPIKKSNFEWKTAFNFSTNKNKVVSLFPDDDTKYIDLGSSDAYVSRIYKGGSIGDLYVYKHKRNEAGQILLDDDGETFLRTTEVEKVGSINPDFSLGWNNSLNYKNWSLNFLINSKIGGKAFSMTEAILDQYGVSQRTADARDQGYVAVDAMQGTTAVTQMDPKTYYSGIGGRTGIGEKLYL